MNNEQIKINITTECSCELYDHDTGELTPAESCDGSCAELSIEWLEEALGEFLEANALSDSDYLLITGERMGWRSLSGYKLVRAEIDELKHALMLNGDFELDFYFSPDYRELTARRYSHDEPTGTGLFRFERVQVCASAECEEFENLRTNRYGETNCEFHAEFAEVN